MSNQARVDSFVQGIEALENTQDQNEQLMASSPLVDLYPVIEDALDSGQLSPPLNSYFWLKLEEERKGMQSLPMRRQATVISAKTSENFMRTETHHEDIVEGQHPTKNQD